MLTPAQRRSHSPMPCRGFENQRARREREQAVRQRVADCGYRLRELGASHDEAAARLGLSPYTLRWWNRLRRFHPTDHSRQTRAPTRPF